MIVESKLPSFIQNVFFSKGVNIYSIIHKHLDMLKVSVRRLPRNLNMQDHQQRVESGQELLEV